MDVWFAWVERHPGLASWVQAVGSIAALLIAFSVVFIQHMLSERSARRREKKADLDLVFALNKVATALHASLAEAVDTSGRQNFESFKSVAKQMSDHAEIIQSFPITHLVALDLSREYLELKSMAQLSHEAFTPRPGTLIYGTGHELLQKRTLRCREIMTEIAVIAERN